MRVVAGIAGRVRDIWETQGLLEDSGLGEQLLLVHFSPLMDLAVLM